MNIMIYILMNLLIGFLLEEISMNNLINLLKDKPIFIPRVLLNNYKALNITEEELIIIMVIMSYEDKVIYNPEEFARAINGNKHDVMRIINNLFDKNILTLVIEKNNRKTYEYISLELLYDKLLNIVIGQKEEIEIDTSIFSIFENELGRTLSPMEYEKIKEWITTGNSNEMITCALREAVLNGVSNFNYIDSILNNWRKKGYKTKVDIAKEKENYRSKKEKVEVYDTDWLNE